MQEDFNLMVFAMPRLTDRSQHPSPNDIAAFVGDEAALQRFAAKEQLTSGYVFFSEPGTKAVALAQRANAAYTDRLLRMTVGV